MPWHKALLQARQERSGQDLWRVRETIDSPQGARVTAGGIELINFCSNDYLGLASSGKLMKAMADGAMDWGSGSGASHLVCGHLNPHHELESEIAEFVGAERALLFSTGYMANLAIPVTFLGRNDLIYQDRLNHASIIDAGQLSRATVKRFHHRDTQQLLQLLEKAKPCRQMIMSDGVFSMDGDQAPISRLNEIASEFDAMLVLDDAHGFGVLGAQGKGSLSSFGLSPAGNVLMVGTLGKAVGTFGAFVAGDSIYIDTLIQHARSYIYTTALPPAVAQATRKALQILSDESWRRERLFEHIERFKSGARELGLNLFESSTPIQPVIIGDAAATISAGNLLRQAGILVTPIRPPTVAAGSSRLRITLCATHTDEDIEHLLSVMGNPAFLDLAERNH